MTISSSIRKAGPYVGTGSQTVFPFAFKVFSASDLYVVKYDTASKAETVLTLTTHYTVSVNADQDNSPGGSVTLLSALASGYTLTLTSKLDYLQPTDLTNQGGFYPEVITTAFDRATVQIQQLAEQVDRCPKVQISSSTNVDVLSAATLAVANDLGNVDTVAGSLGEIGTVSGNISKVNTVADNVADVTNFADVYYGPAATNPATRKDGSALQYGDIYYNTGALLVYVYGSTGWLPAQTPTPITVTTQIFSGTGSQTAFTLSSAPAFLNALDVHISGVNQVPGVDYTLSETSLSFITAPPLGTGNILCRWISPYVGGVPAESVLGPRIGSTGPAGCRNLIRNPKFTVNQRVVSGTVTLTAGSYGHDGWKAGASGCTYTFATSSGRTTLTISAGSLVQTIDGADLFAGSNTYALSWGGTCQGKIGSGSYAASGVTGSAIGGTNIDIEFGTGTLYNPQFEIGTVASSFSCLDDGAELTRCRQYLPAVTNLPLSGTGYRVLGFGYVNSSTSFTLAAPIGTGIKGRPTGIISSGTFTVSASGTGSSATSPTYGTTTSPTVGTVTFTISGLTLGNAGILMADSGSTLSQILFTGLEP